MLLYSSRANYLLAKLEKSTPQFNTKLKVDLTRNLRLRICCSQSANVQGLTESTGTQAETKFVDGDTRLKKQQKSSQLFSSNGPLLITKQSTNDIKLLALDMDGTLLNSSSKILPSSAEAIKAALSKGVQVIVATGKARPGAIKAAEELDLVGPDLLVHREKPGIFLQGLAVYGDVGQPLSDANLQMQAVAQVFEYAMQLDIACCAFHGDTCSTLKFHYEIQELHEVYSEPLAKVAPNLQAILDGPPIKKIILLSSKETIREVVIPFWQTRAPLLQVDTLQAVSTMLEIVPPNINKWNGLQTLCKHIEISTEQVMAIGDGSNDLQMVANVGLGVAMGNGVQKVKDAAKAVVAGNDHDGVAEAIEKFIL
eukprot:TRINITY_DN9432_c0_g1_i5.p2 TRINITY_DN9432_c0_g1~~TRINITY_DN9432_c0_g1_i5.p2  ORF type:complete len:419 (-),score=51.63 TRINITY_DN9432_c0_g1_i5:1222-2325(-)